MKYELLEGCLFEGRCGHQWFGFAEGSFVCPVCGDYYGDHHLVSMDPLPVQLDDLGTGSWQGAFDRSRKLCGEELQIQFEGRQITGWWRLEDDDIVAVWTARAARKATQLGGSPPRALARQMLRELAVEGKA
jgi:hypothetical protein